LLLVGARYRRSTAISISAAIEALTIVGGVVGMAVVARPTAAAVGIILAVVGGGFVYLVTNAFGGALTHQVQLPRSRWLTAEAASFAATGLIFWALSPR